MQDWASRRCGDGPPAPCSAERARPAVLLALTTLPRPPAPTPPTGTWQGLPVAIKTVVFSASTEHRKRALHEAALASSIVHPNIIVSARVRLFLLLLFGGG